MGEVECFHLAICPENIESGENPENLKTVEQWYGLGKWLESDLRGIPNTDYTRNQWSTATSTKRNAQDVKHIQRDLRLARQIPFSKINLGRKNFLRLRHGAVPESPEQSRKAWALQAACSDQARCETIKSSISHSAHFLSPFSNQDVQALPTPTPRYQLHYEPVGFATSTSQIVQNRKSVLQCQVV